MNQYYVYIMANRAGMLYTGVTNDLRRRVAEHQQMRGSKFTARYNIKSLVYFEASSDIRAAIVREKQIKGWLREKKLALINDFNPDWDDLSRDAELDSEDANMALPTEEAVCPS